MRNWIVDYCMQKAGVTKEFKAAWNATLCRVGGKIFLMLGEYKDGRPLMTVKLERRFRSFSARSSPTISSPATTLTKRTGVPSFSKAPSRTTLRARMLDNAYQTTLNGLSKKTRAAILGE
jgi:predicted DNA-binding protein (MmcQ/YjbR family)